MNIDRKKLLKGYRAEIVFTDGTRGTAVNSNQEETELTVEEDKDLTTFVSACKVKRKVQFVRKKIHSKGQELYDYFNRKKSI